MRNGLPAACQKWTQPTYSPPTDRTSIQAETVLGEDSPVSIKVTSLHVVCESAQGGTWAICCRHGASGALGRAGP